MTKLNRVEEIIDCGDHYEVKVRVPVGRRWTGARTYRVTKEECRKKNFTPSIGTAFRREQHERVPGYGVNESAYFERRKMGTFVCWENKYQQRQSLAA